VGRVVEGTEQAIEFRLDTAGETGQHQGEELRKRECPLAGKDGRCEPDGVEEFGGVQDIDESAQHRQEFKIPS